MFMKRNNYYSPGQVVKYVTKYYKAQGRKGKMLTLAKLEENSACFLPKGWLPLLEEFCSSLTPHSHIVDIDVSNSTLRFYLGWSLSKKVMASYKEGERLRIYKEACDLVSRIEEKSKTVCMISGEEGKMVNSEEDKVTYVLCESERAKLEQYEAKAYIKSLLKQKSKKKLEKVKGEEDNGNA